jgi:hypothetical protein
LTFTLPYKRADQTDERPEAFDQLFKSGSDATKMLDGTKESLGETSFIDQAGRIRIG